MADGWQELGSIDELKRSPLREVRVGSQRVALSYADGRFGAVSGVCNHMGGPLCEGELDGDYLVCPWHYWKFHRSTGEGEVGYESDRIPRYELREDDGRLLIRVEPASRRHKLPHAPHKLTLAVERNDGPPRVLGISTTAMTEDHPRYSTSEALLEVALARATQTHGAETRLIRLGGLTFRNCEGFYSKSAQACTWPCSITVMDPTDQMEQVYEGMVQWADVVLVATPIRWGAASALYYKMAERLNCVQNALTTRDKVLIRDKVAAFIITGGQDNVQAVAGQQLGFFAELGFVFPPFPYVAHSRGWSAEDMENNVAQVRDSAELREGTGALVDRSVELALRLRASSASPSRIARGGRKAHRA
ncbi:MAG: NAD(P)H-dependent oxidoreductase [Acidobacteriota bacterium]|nr:NAD(P)H-dependent oxidoreductase [Acidobacteriota bacterium]